MLMKQIILADDDADDREFFEDALNDLDTDTTLTTAKDGVDLMTTLATMIVKPPPPHVIFLDLNMPYKNGFECLKEIRETPKFKDIPVVVLSTSVQEKNVETTYALGANCYVCKPTSHELLKKTIKKILSLELWQDNRQLPKEKFVIKAA
jgi:CheY-like chemotaxis protein